jgi:hypothetical protein
MPTDEQIQARTVEIRRKRITTLLGAWAMLQEVYSGMREDCQLHPHLVAKVVEDYLLERGQLVARDNIKGRIQRHKVADWMAA